MCVKISELLLVKIDPKVVYENLQFDEDQVSIVINNVKKFKKYYLSQKYVSPHPKSA